MKRPPHLQTALVQSTTRCSSGCSLAAGSSHCPANISDWRRLEFLWNGRGGCWGVHRLPRLEGEKDRKTQQVSDAAREQQNPPLKFSSSCMCLTVEVCQFFDIIPQVSRHRQGLSHLQVSLSDEREKGRRSTEEGSGGGDDEVWGARGGREGGLAKEWSRCLWKEEEEEKGEQEEKMSAQRWKETEDDKEQ